MVVWRTTDRRFYLCYRLRETWLLATLICCFLWDGDLVVNGLVVGRSHRASHSALAVMVAANLVYQRTSCRATVQKTEFPTLCGRPASAEQRR